MKRTHQFRNRCLTGGAALLVAMAMGSAVAEDHDRDDRERGWGSHRTLPVPGALLFGAAAIAAAAAAARRRKGGRDSKLDQGE